MITVTRYLDESTMAKLTEDGEIKLLSTQQSFGSLADYIMHVANLAYHPGHIQYANV